MIWRPSLLRHQGPCLAVSLALVTLSTEEAHAQAQDDETIVAATGAASEAESRALIVVVPHRDSLAVSQQLAVELATMGFDASPRRECDQSALEAAIEAGRIAAALCVQKDESGSDVVLLLLPGGQSLISSRPADLEPRVFTLRIAEQARAALLLETSTSNKAEEEPTQKETVTEPTPPSPKKSPPKTSKSAGSTLELALGAAIEGGPGGLGPAVRAQGRVAWWLSRSLGVSALAQLPLHAQSIEADGASAGVWATSLAIGPSLRLLPSNWLQLDSSLYLGGGIVTMVGDAPAPRPAGTDTVLPFLLGGGLGLNALLSAHLFARVDGLFLANVPTVEVRFGGEPVAERPYQLSGSLQLGFTLP